MQKIIVEIIGLGLIGFIYWFFFGKRNETTSAGDTINILVNGGYKPENIKIRKGKTTKLILMRTDPNTCLEEIFIPDFKIHEFLPINQKVEIDLTPKESGTFQTHCGMNMFHGKIIVE